MAPDSGTGQYYVYLLTDRDRSVLYTGITRDLLRRVYQHKHGLIPGFTSRYRVTRLVHFETTTDVRAAITREKEIKKWNRAKKEALIRSTNPMWRDLSEGWLLDRRPRDPRHPTTDPSVVPPSG